MTLLQGSLVANAVLLALAGYITVVAKRRIIQEKLATFAGMLGVMSFSVAAVDDHDRWERLSFALGMFLKQEDKHQVKWRLMRASWFRISRGEPVAADLGEHMHATVLECMRGEEVAEELWAYFDGKFEGRAGCETEPSALFTSQQLAQAQFQLERQLYDMYRADITSRKIKILGG